jgi:hypothetical protein
MKRNYNELLIWAAAVVTVIRYAAAFIASDAGEITGAVSVLITIALGLSGLGMGVLDVIGGAALFQGWRRVMPKSGQGWPFRFKVLTFFVFGLIFNGIIIIVPFTVSRVVHETMETALGGGFWVWFWATAVNVAPYMLIGGVAVSSNLVTTEAEKLPENSGGKKRKLPENSGGYETARPRWNQVPRTEYEWIAQARTGDIQSRYGLDERTARNWRKNAGAK